MYCPECGFHQSEAHKYCGRCGALLIVENQGTGEITGPLAVSDEEVESGAWGGPAFDGPTLAVRSGGPRGRHLLARPRDRDHRPRALGGRASSTT